MGIENARPLKEYASLRLSEARYDPRKLALIYGAAAVGITFLLTLVNYLSQWQIDSTVSGLSGMHSRTLWATVQMVLQTAVSLALPFWSFGFLYGAIRMARGERVEPMSLLEGFRRFGPVLRLQILRGMIFFGMAIACLYVGSFVYAMTPFALPLMEKLQPMIEAGMAMEEMQAMFYALPEEEMLAMVRPALIIGGVMFVLVAVPSLYRFRMADFIIMDEPRVGGMIALVGSGQLMRRNRWKMFKLDLSFWWYYLAMGLCYLLGSADMVLEGLGVQIAGVSQWVWLGLYVAAQLLLLAVYWRSHSYVQTTYAAAFDALRQQKPEPPKPQPVPKNLPWDDNFERQDPQ